MSFIPLIVVSYLNFKSSSEALAERALDSMRSDLASSADELSLLVEEFKRDVIFLSNTPPIQGIIRARSGNGFDEQGNSTLEEWVGRLEAIFEEMIRAKEVYLQIRFIDEKGKEFTRVDFDDNKIRRVSQADLQNKADRDYFVEAMKLSKDSLYVSFLDLNKEEGRIEIPYKPVIRYAVPIFDNMGDRKGIIITNVLAGGFLGSIQDEAGTSGRVFLVDKDGFYLSHQEQNKEWGGSRDLNTGENLSKDFFDLAPQILSREPSIIIIEKEVIAHAPIFLDKDNTENYWVILRSIPKNITFASVISLRNTLLILGLIILSLVSLLAYVLASVISRPIQILSEVARKIGGGDLNVRAKITSKDEIGELAGAFNSMAQKLKIFYADLEKKVRDRTKALETTKKELETNAKELEKERASLEEKVKERTAELEESRVGLEEKVKERTNELEENVDELERFQKFSYGSNAGLKFLNAYIETMLTKIAFIKCYKNK